MASSYSLDHIDHAVLDPKEKDISKCGRGYF